MFVSKLGAGCSLHALSKLNLHVSGSQWAEPVAFTALAGENNRVRVSFHGVSATVAHRSATLRYNATLKTFLRACVSMSANSPDQFSDSAQFILHPTDFSPESELAFCHALRLAVTNEAKLTLLHAEEHAHEDWDRFPAVRKTLERWKLLKSGAHREDIAKLGLGIEKLIIDNKDVVDSIAGYLFRWQVDLLVLATHGREGVSAWLHPSIAERAARETDVPTLFVPADCTGCVDPESGRVTMDQIVVPIDHDPPSEAAIERGLQALSAYGRENSRLTLLHVGPESDFPEVNVPNGPWRVDRVARSGSTVAEILNVADQSKANLMIMVTKGTNGFLDILRGTTTEQVLRQAPCPVLSVPADF
jgi:nucleotide-binding universal stress UspA family protein